MKMNKISLSISTALLAAGFMTSSAVNAQGRLVVYCSATNILCETTTKAFGEKYDVKTSFIRNGSGSTFAKVLPEPLQKLKRKKITHKQTFGLVVHSTLKHKLQS